MNRVLSIAIAASLIVGVGAAHGQRSIGFTASGQQVSSPAGEEPPWKKAIVRWVGPDYPARDRYIGNQGHGLFRLVFDVKTGEVLKVETLRSTGYASLDKSATTALQQWQVRPGTWRAFELPVDFAWAPTQGAAMSKLRRLQSEAEKMGRQARPADR